jgi:hypothetical protein
MSVYFKAYLRYDVFGLDGAIAPFLRHLHHKKGAMAQKSSLQVLSAHIHLTVDIAMPGF